MRSEWPMTFVGLWSFSDTIQWDRFDPPIVRKRLIICSIQNNVLSDSWKLRCIHTSTYIPVHNVYICIIWRFDCSIGLFLVCDDKWSEVYTQPSAVYRLPFINWPSQVGRVRPYNPISFYLFTANVFRMSCLAELALKSVKSNLSFAFSRLCCGPWNHACTHKYSSRRYRELAQKRPLALSTSPHSFHPSSE